MRRRDPIVVRVKDTSVETGRYGAAAHEAFHALHPDASESDAITFGARCRDAARGPTIVADAGG